MDHLQTDQERRARWYSHTFVQYVPVELAKQPVDLVNPPEKHTPKRMVFHSNGYKENDPKIPRTCSLPCWI
jgi:hypothetical protein